MRIFEL